MLQVLLSKSQIRRARRELKRRKLSFVPSFWRRWLLRRGFSRDVHVGDPIKSWDVLKTIEFLEDHVPRDSAVLDIGANTSEVVLALDEAGYRSLTGIDLNPRVKEMPRADRVRYEVGDFTKTPFADDAFSAVTAISVIEHGFDAPALLKEVSRILKPGGFFVASFDYWPEKIDTSSVLLFDMTWRIFSRTEVEEFLNAARDRGLFPHGPLDFAAGENTVDCLDRKYTFAWLVLEKRRAPR